MPKPPRKPARPARSRPAPRRPAKLGDYFAQAFHLSPAVMLLARLPEGELIEVNDTFARLSGFRREDVIGRTTLDLGVWVDHAQRQHFLEKIHRGGRVREYEAEFRLRGGERRWLSLSADVVRIGGEDCMLTVGIDVTDRRRRELLQDTTYRISEAANASGDLRALFGRLHALIGGLMTARNLYFALVSPDGREVSFPYYEDERSTQPAPRPRGRSLTDYVLDTREPLLAARAELDRRLKEGGYAPTGNLSAVWLGAPLVVDGRAIGVVAVQDYADETVYGEEAKRLLTFVAEQAAAAVERRRTEDLLRQSEAARRASQEIFEKSFNASPAMMAVTRLADGILLHANAAFHRAVEVGPEEARGQVITDLGLWVDEGRRAEYRQRLERDGRVRDFEARMANRRGAVRDVLLNAEVIPFASEPCVVVVALDVTDRRRREREQAALYGISAAALDATGRDELFARVPAIIGQLLPAETFFIALYDDARDQISFPLWINPRVPTPPAPRPLGQNLTDYVLRRAEPLHLRGPELEAFVARTGHRPMFGTLESWLAVPLLAGGRALGVLALIDYDNPDAYRAEDAQFLRFVAGQIVSALQRVEVEAARRESREYFSKSFHASPALMLLVSLETGRILEANGAFSRASGYARHEILGRRSLELGIWPDPAERERVLARLDEAGSVHGYETTLRNKAGELRYVLLNVDRLELSGAPSMLITAIDITERHRREQVQDATYRISRAVLTGGDLPALFAELHRIVAGLMPARNFYVAQLDAAGAALSFPYFRDERATAPGGQPPPRPLGLGFTDYVIETGETQLLAADELRRLLAARGPYEPPAGAPAVRLGAPLLVEGRARGVIAIHDYANPRAYGPEEKRLLTFVAEQAAAAVERRRAEEALRAAEERYRGIFENALEGLYTSAPDGRFTNANPAFARLLGYDSPAALVAAAEALGRGFYAEPGRGERFLALLRASDEVTDFESEVVRADGRRVWITESVRAVRDAQGRVERLDGVAVDVTAQRETARALQAAKEEADAASRAKSQFLASMSHELRTPLNGILGYTQILGRDSGLSVRQRAGLDVIQQSADHLLALINDVLDLAKIEARRLELHPTDFDLPEFVRGVAQFFAPRAREKGLRLESEPAPDLPQHVRGDAQRLRQVCYNLLGNAVKFTQRGGVVFAVSRVDDRVRFSVSDTGPGISPADQERLFEPFAQIGDRARHAEGTGLGLNVSRGILEQMGARLQLESRPGWGSRFWFEVALPAAAGIPAAAAEPDRRVTGYAGPRRRVLVADDHAANRQLLRDLLEPLGFEVHTAEDGAAAVAQARALRPDLVLLDLKMPVLDGWAAARAIRAELPADATRLVAMSASAFDTDQRAALDAGCAEFLPKPLREARLLETLARQLGLEWVRGDAAAGADTRAPFPPAGPPPDTADADAIHELACKGDVVAVRAYAEALRARDPRQAAFAQAVIDLAARFKMKAIRQYVARHRADGAPPSP